MIASISGILIDSVEGSLVVEASGLGYQILVTEATRRGFELGNEVKLFTRLIVREDSMTLYGFGDSAELRVFDTLLGVSGVGPKSALAVLDGLSVQQILLAIRESDEKAFMKVPGIGAKTARLIIATLSDRINITPTPSGESTPEAAQTSAPLENNLVAQKLNLALTGLGWSQLEASRVIAQLEAQNELTAQSDLSVLLKKAISAAAEPGSLGGV